MKTPQYKFVGFWLAIVMALLMFVNFARSLLDPTGFSAYMGLPIKEMTDLAWVQVYGLRALFIGLLVVFFLVKSDAA